MKFADFKIGQTFESRITINSDEYERYISFTKIRNILLEKREMAEKEGIKGSFLSGRSILARAEGEMTGLHVFSNNIIKLYDMDGDTSWNCRQTRCLVKFIPERNSVKYIVSQKTDIDDHGYGIVSIDLEIKSEG